MAKTTSENLAQQREEMVRLIERRGIRDEDLCDALRKVRREQIVPEEMKPHAYEDSPLPIGSDQTISQPYVVALMVSELELDPSDRVLEIGTGSGYAAAVIGKLAAEVYTVERVEELATRAAQQLEH